MEYLTIEELYTKITEWAEARNLIKGSDPKSQTLKFFSELGELFAARRGTKEGMTEEIDAIGDCAVVLTILAKQYDFDIHTIHNYEGPFFQGKFYVIAGNMADFVLKNQRDDIWLSIASLIRQLSTYAATIYYGDEETDYRECVQYAYNQIKDRKGVMYKGAFVKSTDAEYPRIMAEMEQQKEDAKLTESLKSQGWVQVNE